MTRVLGWLLLALLLSPLLMAAWVSFSPDSTLSPPVGRWSLRWHAAFLGDERWTAALGRSLMVAASASLVAVIAGGMLALARGRLGFLALLPAMVPPVALALGLMPLWRGSLVGLVLIHGMLGMPLA
ncbi:MAG: ABC transporter permease, partial [Gemmataceae bacterium]|nr:ABC transporter permease [Gemmataceae bacterium]